MKSFKYNTKHKATATVEKRITSTVRLGQPFFLETNILGDMAKYYVDRGGWVTKKNEEGEEYSGTVAHVKNFLPFLDGTRKLELDKPPKRKYTRRTVSRGKI